MKLGNWNLPVEWRASEFCYRLHPKELLFYVSGLVKGRLNIQFMYEKKSEQFFAEHIPRKYNGISEQREGEWGDIRDYNYQQRYEKCVR